MQSENVDNENRSADRAHQSRSPLLVIGFWILFAAGLAVQLLSNGLKVKNNVFVVPPSMVSPGKTLDVAAVIAYERRIQLLSVLLTVGGAVGLAFCYRQALFRRRQP